MFHSCLFVWIHTIGFSRPQKIMLSSQQVIMTYVLTVHSRCRNSSVFHQVEATILTQEHLICCSRHPLFFSAPLAWCRVHHIHSHIKILWNLYNPIGDRDTEIKTWKDLHPIKEYMHIFKPSLKCCHLLHARHALEIAACGFNGWVVSFIRIEGRTKGSEKSTQGEYPEQSHEKWN